MGVQNSNLKPFFTKSSFQNQEWVTSNQVVGQRGSMGMAKTNQAVVKAMSCFLQTDSKVLLLKITNSLQVCRIQTDAFLEASFLWSSVLGTEKYCTHCKRKNINTYPTTKSLIYNAIQPTKHDSAMVTQGLGKYPNHIQNNS